MMRHVFLFLLVIKDPSSPMEVCPFCGKAFKRLKSHLPHCKMADTKTTTPEKDCRDKSMTANPVPMQETDTTLPVVEKQNLKAKGKSKIEGPKSHIWQDKKITLSQTTQLKVGKVVSENTLTQKKAGGATGLSKKAPPTTRRTSRVVTLTEKQCEDQVTLTESNAPIRQALLVAPNLERMVPTNVDSPRVGNNCQTAKVEENLEGHQARLSSEQDTVESSVKYIGVGDDPQGRFNVQVEVNQNSEPRSLSGSNKASMVFGRPTSFSQEGAKIQVPGISPTVCNMEAEMCNIKALRTIEKSVGIKMDMLSPPKAVQIDGPLGLQWTPQLYSSYVQLQVVPGRQDQWDLEGRGTKTLEPIGSLPELCKAGFKESIVEKPPTSKRLMDVRLGELPAWLAKRSFSPKKFPEFMANAWARYYDKYINVKKGGAGGLTMLLAGYCILSYSWNYQHIKLDRLRKYH
ncbi:hypothetical protein GDO78_004042 [Eleutherodactylus coqui]|uniref:ATP synthase membrane subunit f n=1 Tax=Eleutherodactylus coqui TaxID=57060 RepID=A0A8J6EQJ0_ELECQ|nr:hypothetical protein GDO78_004042 [Eleutherodactylus coqui]